MSINRYLKRMDASMHDKLRVINALPDNAELVLDVGCASGHVTGHMAAQLPDIHFHGIDVELPFVGMAQRLLQPENVSFSHNWLGDLQQYNTRYDAITFMSVLHEVYSYGRGVSSVVKILADAYELLHPGGRIIIRDMIPEQRNVPVQDRMTLYDKLEANINLQKLLADYDRCWDIHSNGLQSINDFLLHLLYVDNWDNEVREHYMFWNTQDYKSFLVSVLGMELIHEESYLLDYVRNRWIKELWLNDMECDILYSTGVMVFEK